MLQMASAMSTVFLKVWINWKQIPHTCSVLQPQVPQWLPVSQWTSSFSGSNRRFLSRGATISGTACHSQLQALLVSLSRGYSTRTQYPISYLFWCILSSRHLVAQPRVGAPHSHTQPLLVEIDFVLDYTKPMSIISLLRQGNQHLL